MGRKKIHNLYDGRKHLVTFRLKYWEHQKLVVFASKMDKSVSDVCRMFVSHGIENINQALAEEDSQRTGSQY